MNLRQEIDGVKLNWQKLNGINDIKKIPFKDFSQVVVFIESYKCAAEFCGKINRTYWHGNYIWFYSNGEYYGWDSDLDAYPLNDDEDWNTIGTYYIPERKAAIVL